MEDYDRKFVRVNINEKDMYDMIICKKYDAGGRKLGRVLKDRRHL